MYQNNEMPSSRIGEIRQEVSDATPEHCKGCGVQCELSARLYETLLKKVAVTSHAEQTLVGPAWEEMSAGIDENTPPEVADKLKQRLRSGTAHILDNLDRQAELIKQEKLDNSNKCDGTLTVRASTGDDSYTVTICTSKSQYDDGAGHHHAHIERYTTEPQSNPPSNLN